MEYTKESAVTMALRAKRVTTWVIGPDGKPKRLRNNTHYLEGKTLQQPLNENIQYLDKSGKAYQTTK